MWARWRRQQNPPQSVRLFEYPKKEINFDADTIMELLDLDYILATNPSYITEPPLLKDFSQGELMELLQASAGPDGINPLDYLCNETLTDGDQKNAELGKKLSAIKCHSLYNEKAVQQTTDAVKRFIGHEKQRGAVVSIKESVDQIPITATKSFCRKLEF